MTKQCCSFPEQNLFAHWDPSRGKVSLRFLFTWPLTFAHQLIDCALKSEISPGKDSGEATLMEHLKCSLSHTHAHKGKLHPRLFLFPFEDPAELCAQSRAAAAAIEFPAGFLAVTVLKGSANKPASAAWPLRSPRRTVANMDRTVHVWNTCVLPQDYGSCINYTCEICQAHVDTPWIFTLFWYKIRPRVFVSTLYLWGGTARVSV